MTSAALVLAEGLPTHYKWFDWASSIQDISLTRSSYIRTILGIYYKNDDGPTGATSVIYNMTYDQISKCVGELVPDTLPIKTVELLKEETIDRVLSVMMKWTQRRIADDALAHRLIYSILTCVGPFANRRISAKISKSLQAALKGLVDG